MDNSSKDNESPRHLLEAATTSVSIADAQLHRELQRIAGMMRAAQPNLNQVARELNRVDELARDILKYVNSPGIGLRHNISRVEHAVAMLGQRRTLELIESRLELADQHSNLLHSNLPHSNLPHSNLPPDVKKSA